MLWPLHTQLHTVAHSCTQLHTVAHSCIQLHTVAAFPRHRAQIMNWMGSRGNTFRKRFGHREVSFQERRTGHAGHSLRHSTHGLRQTAARRPGQSLKNSDVAMLKASIPFLDLHANQPHAKNEVSVKEHLLSSPSKHGNVAIANNAHSPSEVVVTSSSAINFQDEASHRYQSINGSSQAPPPQAQNPSWQKLPAKPLSPDEPMRHSADMSQPELNLTPQSQTFSISEGKIQGEPDDPVRFFHKGQQIREPTIHVLPKSMSSPREEGGPSFSFGANWKNTLSKKIIQFRDCIRENDCYAPAVDDFIRLINSELQEGDDWLNLSIEALETIIDFILRCLQSQTYSPRYNYGLTHLGYIIDVIEHTKERSMAKYLAKHLGGWAYRREAAPLLLHMVRRLEKLKTHSRTPSCTSFCNVAALNFSETQSNKRVHRSMVPTCNASIQTSSTEAMHSKRKFFESEAQTDLEPVKIMVEKGTDTDASLWSSEVRQLRAEIAHLKNSNKYGDLLLKLHAVNHNVDV